MPSPTEWMNIDFIHYIEPRSRREVTEDVRRVVEAMKPGDRITIDCHDPTAPGWRFFTLTFKPFDPPMMPPAHGGYPGRIYHG